MQQARQTFCLEWPLMKPFWDSTWQLGHFKAHVVRTEPSPMSLLHPFPLFFLSTLYHPTRTREHSFPSGLSLGFSFSSPSPILHPFLSYHGGSDPEHGMDNLINFLGFGQGSAASCHVGCSFPCTSMSLRSAFASLKDPKA